MTGRRQNGEPPVWRIWTAPLAAWLSLVVLFAMTLGSAYVPLGSGNVTVNLLIAAVMVAILVTFLMDLQHSTVLVRIVAAAGIFWVLIMFVLTFDDYLSRHY